MSLRSQWPVRAVALTGLAVLAGCMVIRSDFENGMIERFDSCAQGRHSDQDYVRMSRILTEMFSVMDVSDDNHIDSDTRQDSVFVERAAYNAIEALFDNDVKICFGPTEQNETVSYDFFNKSILVKPDADPAVAAQATARYITEMPVKFWTLQGPNGPTGPG